jgi:hypothetical protein
MPAAVSENTPQDGFGLNLANRRCSERFAVSRSLHQRPGKAKRKAAASAKAERKAPNGKAAKRSRNRQVEGKGRKAGTNRLTGPDAGSGAGR